jgi:hypothetical protein
VSCSPTAVFIHGGVRFFEFFFFPLRWLMAHSSLEQRLRFGNGQGSKRWISADRMSALSWSESIKVTFVEREPASLLS